MPAGLSEAEYKKKLEEEKKAKNQNKNRFPLGKAVVVSFLLTSSLNFS